MRVFKKVMHEVLEVDSCLCNKCGKDFFNEGVHINTCGGYESKHLGDMMEYDFDLCEKCLWDVIQSLKLPPRGYDQMDGVVINEEGVK